MIKGGRERMKKKDIDGCTYCKNFAHVEVMIFDGKTRRKEIKRDNKTSVVIGTHYKAQVRCVIYIHLRYILHTA